MSSGCQALQPVSALGCRVSSYLLPSGLLQCLACCIIDQDIHANATRCGDTGLLTPRGIVMPWLCMLAGSTDPF